MGSEQGVKDAGRYFSAEFQLEKLRILFQFRLRQGQDMPVHILVKKDSQALDVLKAGQTVPMTLYFEEGGMPAERREVLVCSVEDAPVPGLSDHFMVAFNL